MGIVNVLFPELTLCVDLVFSELEACNLIEALLLVPE